MLSLSSLSFSQNKGLLDYDRQVAASTISDLSSYNQEFRKEFSCEELIMNSISTHWVLSNKQGVPYIIKEWGLVDYDNYFDKDKLVKEIVLDNI